MEKDDRLSAHEKGQTRDEGTGGREQGTAAQGHPLTMAEVTARARPAMQEFLEQARADPDAYAMLEIMCLNQLVEAELKARKMDVAEPFQAQKQGKQLEAKAAWVESQNELAEAETEKLRLQSRLLEHQLDEIRREVERARDAKQKDRPFDYDRALKQISALVGLSGPEEFRHDEEELPPN